MIAATESRATTGLQLFGILALLVSIILLLAVVNQIEHNRKQTELVGEVSRVLVELEQLTIARPVEAGFSDSIAPLIAYGDAQVSEISIVRSNALFRRESAELRIAKTHLVQMWETVKSTFALSNVVEAHAENGSVTKLRSSTQEEQLQEFLQIQESFDRLFTAISQDTLSAVLLAANSQLLATLKNLEFVLSNRDNLNLVAYNRLLRGSFSTLQSDLTQLSALTNTRNGGILIGYESRQLLNYFTTLVKNFKPVPLTERTPSEFRNKQEQQRSLTSAIDSAASLQQLLDIISHQSRRAILFAITALCLALICLMFSLWKSWRNVANGVSAKREELELLRAELTAIANGDLTVRASQQGSATLNAIAEASNHTVEMLTGLVRLVRRAGNHLNELTRSQQYLAKRWVKSEIRWHEQIDLIAQALDIQSLAVKQLQEIKASAVNANNTDNRRDNSSSNAALQALALKISACREMVGIASVEDSYSVMKNCNLSGEGLLRMRQRMHELTGTISAVRLAAEQARLQVLNASLQMTAYAGTAEIDDQSRLVEEIQNVSNQLASSAAGAERMSSALTDDLQQYAEAFASDKHELVNQFDQLQRSVNLCLELSFPDSGDKNDDSDASTIASDVMTDLAVEASERDDLIATLDNVQQQQLLLHKLVADLRSGVNVAIDGDAIELLDQIGEIQNISMHLNKSAEMYGSASE